MLPTGKNAAEYGVTVQCVQVDFGKVMERMRRLRASISPTDSCDRFQNQLGIDVFQVHKGFSGTCREKAAIKRSQSVHRVLSALIKLQLYLIPFVCDAQTELTATSRLNNLHVPC